MKTRNLKLTAQAGWTLAETAVTTGLTVLVGLVATQLTLNSTVLYAKNTAENAAHDQNRIAVSRIVRDIHAATSIPQLGKIVTGNLAANPTAPTGSWTPYGTNLTFWAESGTGPSAGISFKKMGSPINPNGGPFEVKNDPGNVDLIMIKSGTSAPQAGMELIFPYYGMEGTVRNVNSNGSDHYNVFVDGGLETRIKTKKDVSIICYYMSRYAYVVENGDLKFYSSAPPPTGVTWPIVVARNIVEPPSKTPIEVQVRDDRYNPSTVTIRRGETISWKWKSDGDNRSVTTKAPQPITGAFNSGVQNSGHEFAMNFPLAQTFQYNSTTRTSMIGTVIVAERNYNAKPFSQTSSQYVTVNLTTEDNRYSNRNYKAINTLLAGSVPIRAQISKTQ